MTQEEIRDKTMDTIITNQIQAGVLLPGQVRHRLANLESLDDVCLNLVLAESWHLLDLSLELAAYQRKN